MDVKLMDEVEARSPWCWPDLPGGTPFRFLGRSDVFITGSDENCDPLYLGLVGGDKFTDDCYRSIIVLRPKGKIKFEEDAEFEIETYESDEEA